MFRCKCVRVVWRDERRNASMHINLYKFLNALKTKKKKCINRKYNLMINMIEMNYIFILTYMQHMCGDPPSFFHPPLPRRAAPPKIDCRCQIYFYSHTKQAKTLSQFDKIKKHKYNLSWCIRMNKCCACCLVLREWLVYLNKYIFGKYIFYVSRRRGKEP